MGVPRIPKILLTSQTQNISVSNSIETDEKELVIVEDVEHEVDPETVSQGTPDINIEDENDEIADTADDAETQENNIDQPVINIISTQQSNPQEIETRRQSYAMGLQH